MQIPLGLYIWDTGTPPSGGQGTVMQLWELERRRVCAHVYCRQPDNRFILFTPGEDEIRFLESYLPLSFRKIRWGVGALTPLSFSLEDRTTGFGL